MNAEEMKQKFEERGYETWLREREEGIRIKTKRLSLWVKVDKEKIKDAIGYFVEIAGIYPHFSIISASDEGESVELNYHFTTGFGGQHEEYSVNFKVAIPKNDLVIDSITDIVPAVIYSEREIREMMGVEFEGLQDKRHMFLTKDFPDGVYPWRRDETAPKGTNKLYETWKEGAK